MKVLVLGAGGVGAAFAAIAQRRSAFDRVVLADISPERVRTVVAGLGEPGRFSAERVDASSRIDVALLDELRSRRARRRGPRRRGLRLRPDVLDLDDDRGGVEPAADLGARARLLHDPSVLGA